MKLRAQEMRVVSSYVSLRGSTKVHPKIFPYLICESFIWCIRRQLAQRAFLTIATFVLPISATKWQGSYLELFFD